MALTDTDDGDWLRDEEDELAVSQIPARPWRVLVVDDEPDIHAVTRLALNSVSFKGRGIEILSAYTGIQGYEMLATESDIALVLLDVVMETEDAGLRLARRIREELNNQLVRIVLRTGQPGQAPEQKVIVDFDINDYKAKTELTVQKLFTTVISSLRSYEGLLTIDANRRGLARILEAASNLYQLDSLKELASGVLTQIGAILNFGTEGVLCIMQNTASGMPSAPLVIASTGASTQLEAHMALPAEHIWATEIHQAFQERKNVFSDTVDVLFIHAPHGHLFVVAFSPPWPLGDLERSLLGVFCDRIAAAFDNLHMFGMLKTTQEATVVALADLAESRDATTGGHVRRVCRLTDGIAAELHAAGKFPDVLTPAFMSMAGLASILHDVGKVATPDAILLKPGRHTPEERAIMEEHALIGETVLARAAKMVEGVSTLSMGAQIAGGHHEHFDGSGYPRQLKGHAIPLEARIVAVVDVFDALLHRRPYKEPWELDAVLAYLQERRNTQFDPDVLDALDAFLRNQQPDWIIGDDH
jgi:response regulator RpfG family c-di-GMP phosphodiesterase